jgi:hypothetical protein
MQVTELQVQRSLLALTADGHPRSPIGPADSDAPHDLATATSATAVPDGLVERLSGAPAMRGDRLAEARLRLETGDQPTAEALAQRMVGRLVCDRLR